MDNTVEIEFQHNGYDVEAVFSVQKPDFYSKESDWDYNGFQTLEHYSVFEKGKEVFSVDIPDDVMYHHLREHLRSVEIEGCFKREEEL